jgi:hypothetical protein
MFAGGSLGRCAGQKEAPVTETGQLGHAPFIMAGVGLARLNVELPAVLA